MAFFYGNTVPIELAYQLYEACSEMTMKGVKQEVCSLYTWFRTVNDGYGIHLGFYYNLHRRLYLYINGPKLCQLEPVIPKHRHLFGFGTILCPETDIVLNHVRHVKVWCGIPFL